MPGTSGRGIQLALFAYVLFASAIQLAAQQESVHLTVSRTLEGMNARTWELRAKAFEEMPNVDDVGKRSLEEADRLKKGLILLLRTENAALKHQVAAEDVKRDRSEEYEEYYARLIGIVATLDDERAISALLAAAPTGSMATRGVARFGSKALGPVLEQVECQDVQLASGAVHVLREMLKMQTASDRDSHLLIKKVLRLALAHPEFQVRLSGIGAIEYLDDRREFVPMLRDLAEHDPFELDQPDNRGSIVGVFVVRVDAARLLRQIADH
jgi:hypothetical protein